MKRGDRDIFRLLHHFTFLSNYQIIYFLKNLYGEKPVTTRKRYKRFRDKGLLLSKTYAKTWGSPYKIYFYLSQKGFNLLKDNNLLDDNTEEYDGNFRRLGGEGRKDHFFAVRDAILLSLIEAGKIEADINETSFREQLLLINPYKNPDPLIIPGDRSSKEVIPDWIVKIPAPDLDPYLAKILNDDKDQCLYYEIDNGTERKESIQGKVEKYIKLAHIRKHENHHVLFPVIDRSHPDLKYDIDVKDRRVRIKNLKNHIIEVCLKRKPIPNNLSFYVFSISRTGKIAKKLMYEEYQNKERMKMNFLAAIEMVRNNNPYYKFEFKELDKEQVYRADVREEDYAELILEFFIRGNKRTVIFKLMEEGNVQDYDSLEYHNTMMKNDSFRVKVDDIVAVYQTKDELIKDVLEHGWKHILFTDMDSIEANAKSDNFLNFFRYQEKIINYDERFEEVEIL